MPTSTLLQNGRFLLPDDRIERGEMLITDGVIKSISAKVTRIPANTNKINLNDNYVIPGFIQTHVHLCQTMFRNHADDLPLLDWLKQKIWPMEAAHTAESLFASAQLGIAELLSGGTTTILDMGTVHHTDSIFAAAKALGIRANIGKCLMDRPDSPKGLRQKTKDLWKDIHRISTNWHGTEQGRLQYSLAPRFVLSCTEKLLRELVPFAQEKKYLIHTHSSENLEEVKAVRSLYGRNNVEALHHMGLTKTPLVLAHCIWLSKREQGILAEHNVHVSHCPSSNLKLGSGIASVPELREQGINVTLGADGAPCANNLSMLQEMRLCSLLQKPRRGPQTMTAKEAFSMATIGGARALGLESKIGTLEVGKEADLVVLDLQHPNSATNVGLSAELLYSTLVYSADRQNISQTFVAGKCVYDSAQYPEVWQQTIVPSFLTEQKKLLRRSTSLES